MNSDSEKSDYLLLFRGADWHRDLSPDELQKTMTVWMAWFNRLVGEAAARAASRSRPSRRSFPAR
ncbi:MAG: hypothetical protein WDN28_30145 [Chthoniobacter sp.]